MVANGFWIAVEWDGVGWSVRTERGSGAACMVTRGGSLLQYRCRKDAWLRTSMAGYRWQTSILKASVYASSILGQQECALFASEVSCSGRKLLLDSKE